MLPDAWAGGSLWQGLLAATFPANVPTLAPLAGALIASTAATLTLAWLAPLRTADAAR